MTMLSIGLTAAIRIGWSCYFFRSAPWTRSSISAAPSPGARSGAEHGRRDRADPCGLFVEVFMSLGVITGIADRACAFVLAGYCGVTALLWKQFWKPGDFWSSEHRPGSDAVLGFPEELRAWRRLSAHHLRHRCGFGRPQILRHPLSSSHPYSVTQRSMSGRERLDRQANDILLASVDRCRRRQSPDTLHDDRIRESGNCAGSRSAMDRRQDAGCATVFVTVLPVGWIGDWHENPKPQWIIPLSGRWFVESMDGQRVEMGPGEISFGEDKNTRNVAASKGTFPARSAKSPRCS
jgi:uncharacterized membrane protein YphA (DoxX/SURF4 family)